MSVPDFWGGLGGLFPASSPSQPTASSMPAQSTTSTNQTATAKSGLQFVTSKGGSIGGGMGWIVVIAALLVAAFVVWMVLA